MPSDPIPYALDRLEERLNEAREELEHIRRLLAIGAPREDEDSSSDPESGSVR